MTNETIIIPEVQEMGFNSNKIAPSLVDFRYPKQNSDWSSPEDSMVFDEDDRENDPLSQIGELGLSKNQEIELKKRIQKARTDAEGYWGHHYKLMKEDWKIYSNKDVWSVEAKNARKGRPILSFPLTGKFVRRTVGDLKKNPPSVKLSPRTDGDIRKADIGMGLVRYIEQSCGAKYAYTHGFECAVIGGLGWIKGDYDAVKNKILIKKVKNPFAYMLDPKSVEIDGSDAEWIISSPRITRNEKVEEVTEFWWREKDDENAEFPKYEVYWAILDGDEIIDYGHFPSEIIPIFPVFGEDIEFEDDRVIKGIVRDLTDAQKSYNYLKSQEVEVIALTPKAPIIAEEGTIPQEYMKSWNNATKNPERVLFYRMTNLDGNEAKSRPEFLPMKADTEWARSAAVASINDLKEITGIYDTALGSDSKELSGKAIIAKQLTADASQFIYTEHLQATIQQIGRWLIEMIPFVFTNERVIQVIGEDGSYSSVNLDMPYGANVPKEQQEPISLDFNEMDIAVESSPAFSTRRQEGLDAFQSIMQALPETASYIADLAIKNMDVPFAQDAAKRLFKMLPPQLQDNSDNAPQGFVPASQLQDAMKITESIKQQSDIVIKQMEAKIAALEAEVKNQTTGRIAQARVQGEYALAREQLKEANQNAREALEIQADVEKTTKQIQKDILLSSAERTANAARQAVSENLGKQGIIEETPNTQILQQQEIQPTEVADISFKKPTLVNDKMTQEEMLLNL